MVKEIRLMMCVSAVAILMSACSTIAPLAVSGNPIGKKVGTAKANFILGLTFGSDYSIQTAAKNGGISKVSTVDVRYYNVLGVFESRKTIVTGE